MYLNVDPEDKKHINALIYMYVYMYVYACTKSNMYYNLKYVIVFYVNECTTLTMT